MVVLIESCSAICRELDNVLRINSQCAAAFGGFI
jgi:hypothetical protein